MKIVRFVSREGQVLYGQVEADEFPPTQARTLFGDIRSGFRSTERSVEVQRLLAPIEPPDILAVGLNYRRHVVETGAPVPERPVLFIKAGSSLIGPGAAILLPMAGPDEVDFEGELAVVIGREGKNVPREKAKDFIFGYTCANDISARDWQMRLQGKQWSRGKSIDTFCPVGPWIVTADEILDPDALRMRTLLNGRVVQESSTADMIFSVPELVSDLSRSLTLRPGTLILTGTPAGVGFTRRPPLFLKAGDEVTVEIEKIGSLVNPVAAEICNKKNGSGAA